VSDFLSIFGLKFTGLRVSEVIKEADTTKVITTVNAEFIVEANEKNERLKNIISTTVSTFDGQVPYFIAKLFNSNTDFHKISGSDLIYDFIDKARKESLSVFILGGKEETNLKAVKNIRDKGVQAFGYSPPYSSYPFSDGWCNDITQILAQKSPDILLVCFGAVKQEFWIDDNLDFLNSLNVKFVYGAGGTVDFVAGTKSRAPVFFQRTGLEGIYRLFEEPKLFRFMRILKSFRLFKYI
jgi:N-acetylglucosaminyldiphosphoundecaprenol N-acetyl-beta-D-mannosaminyltransferase